MSHPTILAIFHQDVRDVWCCVTCGLLYLAAGVAERPWPSLRSCCRDMMWTLPTLSSCPTGTSALPQSRTDPSQRVVAKLPPVFDESALAGFHQITKPRPPKGWAMNCRDGGGGETTCTLKAWGHRMHATKVFQAYVPIDWGNYWAWQNLNPIQSTYCRVLAILLPLFFVFFFFGVLLWIQENPRSSEHNLFISWHVGHPNFIVKSVLSINQTINLSTHRILFVWLFFYLTISTYQPTYLSI